MVPVVGRAMAARVALTERSGPVAPAVTVGLIGLPEVGARAFRAQFSALLWAMFGFRGALVWFWESVAAPQPEAPQKETMPSLILKPAEFGFS